ncbi:MAG: FAD-dependent oxidoreductase [Planctomycetes bacterium]|nr:FAD-dependent oxidoreductase [Planctomycetota bacterium]
MSLRVGNLRVSVSVSENELPQWLAKRLNIAPNQLVRWRVLKKSLDSRSPRDLQFVYSVLVDVAPDVLNAASFQKQIRDDVQQFQLPQFDELVSGEMPLHHRPIVVGSGPAGLLAGYVLALKGYQPLILERGESVKERVPVVREFDKGGHFDPENNYLFGEGGAGCFSDGKLTCRMEGPDVDWVLERFVECGGRESIVYENRPHLGSNRLPLICRNFRRKIESMGGEYRFGCRMEQIDVSEGRVVGLQTSSGYLATNHVILGIGHSARDTYQMLHTLGVPLQQKAFQLGLRIEQPQEQINRYKYARPEYLHILGAADYSLRVRSDREVFSFCMCAGGVIMPSISEAQKFCSNGMSNSRHDTPFANSGIVVTLETHEFGSTHPLAGMHIQQKYEGEAFRIGRGNYLCPIQSATEFVNQRTPHPDSHYDCTYKRGTIPAALDQVLPPVLIAAIRRGLPIMDQKLRGQFLKNAILVGPEMRGSSPIRIDRDRITRQSPGFAGLYPVGEGAGYAGGIVSAAVDGLRSAREIVRSFAPLK